MRDADLLTKEILVEGLDDWVPVDRLIGRARELRPSGEECKSLFRQALDLLLSQGFAVAGEVGDEGFVPWSGSVPQVMERVVSQCEELAWEPLGAGCWLANTRVGDEHIA